MKIQRTISIAILSLSLVGCDEHRDFPDTSVKTCDILCTDGEVVRFDDLSSEDKEPIAVVFHINQRDDMEGTAYAVYLWAVLPEA